MYDLVVRHQMMAPFLVDLAGEDLELRFLRLDYLT